MSSALAFDSLQFLQHNLWRGAVAGAANILPANDAVLVDNECGGLGDIVASKHIVGVDCCPVGVGKYWEWRAPLVCGSLGSFQVVRTDREDDSVFLLYRCVVFCQLDELLAAERSPERAVEDEHNILVASE